MQQQPTRRGPLSVVAPQVAGSAGPPELGGDVQAVLALVGRAWGADQAAVGAMETVIALLQEALVTLRTVADAKGVLATQVPIPLLREALARHSASRVEGER